MKHIKITLKIVEVPPYFNLVRLSTGLFFVTIPMGHDVHINITIINVLCFIGTRHRMCDVEVSEVLKNARNCAYVHYITVNYMYIAICLNLLCSGPFYYIVDNIVM